MSAYAIEVRDEYGVAGLPVEGMERAADWVLARHGVQPGMALTLIVTGDDEVQALNVQYRGVDAPTDILSFPAEPLPEAIQAEMDEAPYLGDLIIAYPYTLRHAEEAGHALSDELALLAIHGTLHLLGFDHDTAEHQAAMWAAQAEALAAQGIRIDVPLFTFGSEDDA